MSGNKHPRFIQNRNKNIFVTALLVISLCIGFCFLSVYVNHTAEESGMEKLMYNTDWLSKEIRSGIETERGQLELIANIIAEIPDLDKEKIQGILGIYEEEGLISRLEILFPGDKLLMKDGEYDVSKRRSFEDEKERGAYISDVEEDVIHPEQKILRIAAPITENDAVRGVLYGIIEQERLEGIFDLSRFGSGVQIYLIDGENGDFLIDTWHNELGNLRDFSVRKPKKGYSITQSHEELSNGNRGTAVFFSQKAGEYFLCIL